MADDLYRGFAGENIKNQVYAHIAGMIIDHSMRYKIVDRPDLSRQHAEKPPVAIEPYRFVGEYRDVYAK